MTWCQRIFLSDAVISLILIGSRWRYAMPPIRWANITPDTRELFDLLGVDVVRHIAQGVWHVQERDLQLEKLQALFQDLPRLRMDAVDWLRERAIADERHEVRIEIVEWAILGYVFVKDAMNTHSHASTSS